MSLSFKKVVLMALVISGINLQAENNRNESKATNESKAMMRDTFGWSAGIMISGVVLTTAALRALEKETNVIGSNNAIADTTILRAGLLAGGTANLAITIIENMDNHRPIRDIIQPIIIGACTPLIAAAAGNESMIVTGVSFLLCLSANSIRTILANDLNSEKQSLATWALTGATVLATGVEYSDHGTQVKLFGKSVWTSTQAEQPAPAA